MCGFAGFVGEVENRNQVLTDMMNTIVHRGPDSEGRYVDEDAALGFRRLSIIDLSEVGDQPLYNEDKTLVLVFNGEIYNYQELRKELVEAGHVFASNTDSETLVHGFEEWGEKLVDRLRGMYAFAIWDIKKKKLFAARDIFGIKPLYFAQMNQTLLFGSEIKSFLEHPKFDKIFNEDALGNYLSFQFVPSDETFFKGVFCLQPGHYFTYENGEMKITRYFEPEFTGDSTKSFEEVVDEIEKVMKESVEMHKISDVEVASYLSSGVDSSYLTYLGQVDHTFTVGFEEGKYSEIQDAKEFAESIRMQNDAKVITPEEYWASLSDVQYYMDEPVADPAAVALYFLSREAAKKVKVVLSGEGSDELFGGYNIYREPHDLAGFQKLPYVLRKGLASCASALPFRFKGKNFLIRASKPVEERFIGNAFMFNEKERSRVLKNPTGKYNHTELTKPFYDKVKNQDDVTKMQYIDINFWLIGDILLKADKMSMAHSLEVRVPFLDREVFDVARHIPTKYKVNKQNTKYAMRMAAHRYLPDMVAEKKKLGFPVPIRIWLRDEKYYNVIKKAFHSEAANKYFNTDVLMQYLDEHKEGKADNSRKIWTVYMFLVWYEDFFGDTKQAA